MEFGSKIRNRALATAAHRHNPAETVLVHFSGRYLCSSPSPRHPEKLAQFFLPLLLLGLLELRSLLGALLGPTAHGHAPLLTLFTASQARPCQDKRPAAYGTSRTALPLALSSLSRSVSPSLSLSLSLPLSLSLSPSQTLSPLFLLHVDPGM